MNGFVETLTGKAQKKTARMAARQRQEDIDAQTAIQNRQRNTAETDEAEESGQRADLLRARRARTRQRSRLAFSGASDKKETFGG